VDQEQVLASHSGLLNYLFGVNREKVLTKDRFKKLQSGESNDPKYNNFP
jgi:hypothetical protein